MSRPVLLDCDTGTDDAVAIMLAALHPALDLRGVTTCFGNDTVEATTRNTRSVLAVIGRPAVPVTSGAASAGAGSAGAARWLAKAVTASPLPVTVVATGPLTNLAAALAVAPGLTADVAELVVMGGSDAVPNVTPRAERNIWNDPASAASVFSAGWRRLVVVPLDATMQAALTPDQAGRLTTLGTPAGRAAGRLVLERIEAHTGNPALGGRRAAPVHDALAVAYLLDESVVDLRPAHVDVDTVDGPDLGRTRFDLDGSSGHSPNAFVALGADHDRFFELLASTFAGQR